MFLPLIRRGRNADQYQAMGLLREYLSYRSDEGEAAVLTDDKVFQRSGVSDANLYFSSVLGIDSEQEISIRTNLKETPLTVAQVVFPIKRIDGSQGLLFCYPLPPYSETNTYLMVSLSSEEVADMFLPLLGNLEGSAFLLNGYGELIFSTGDIDLANYSQQLEYGKDRQVITIEIGNEPYSVIYAKSALDEVVYGVMVAENTYLTEVIEQTMLVWLAVLLALVICVAIIVLLTILNYRPIKQLLALTGATSQGCMDEYGEIGKTVISTRDRANLLENTLVLQRPYVLERILGYVLGSQMTGDQSRQLFTGMGLRFDYPCFFIICVKAVIGDGGRNAVSALKTAVVESLEVMTDDSTSANIN
jgi:hypothetical protein